MSGERASRIAASWSEKTHAARRGLGLEPDPASFGQFGALLSPTAGRLLISSDGIGSKVEVAERMQRFDTLGQDLLAMVVDDVAAMGAEPCVVSNVLDVSCIDLQAIDALFAGLHAAATPLGVAVACGEIAELGARIQGHGTGMHLSWSATCLGVLPSDWPLLDGRALAPGQRILAATEPGFRANGFTCLRSILRERYGDSWHRAGFAEQAWGELALAPSRIYAPLVVAMRRAGVDLRGVAHVTGGGIPAKLGRVLRARALGAQLRLPPPPPALVELLRLGGLDLPRALDTFGMGVGLLLVLPEPACAAALEVADQLGYALHEVGEVCAHAELAIEVLGERVTRAGGTEWSRR